MFEDPRFSGIARLYGSDGLAHLNQSHMAVIGLGGVGSWIAEALIRSAVGELTIFDLDDVCLSNINRQVLATTSTVGQNKAVALKSRLLDINPEAKIHAVEDFVTASNLHGYIDGRFAVVADAIDSVVAKSHLLAHCKRQKIAVISIGGAGAQIDPLQIKVADLNRSWNDPLLAKVRSLLRQQFNYSRNPKRYYSIPAVFSTEQPRYPQADGSIDQRKPVIKDGASNCHSGFGAATMVTASFGMIAAARMIDMLLKQVR